MADSDNHATVSAKRMMHSRILHKAAHEDRQINIHQLSESFSMETIGSCVFGVRAGCFECIDSEFIGIRDCQGTFLSRYHWIVNLGTLVF